MPTLKSTKFVVLFTLIMIPIHSLAGIYFEAHLSGSQVVPPTPSSRTGTAVFILNESQTEVEYSIDFSTLVEKDFAVNFRSASPGNNGPVLYTPQRNAVNQGVWALGHFNLLDLLNGRIYVELCTGEFPEGEIRGNLGEPVSPAEIQSWSNVKALY